MSRHAGSQPISLRKTILCIAFGLALSNAAAQTERAAQEPDTYQLAPLNVTGTRERSYQVPEASTATKTETPIMETPVSIQVIPKAVLEDKQTMSLPDAVNGQVSGTLGRTGGGYLYDNFIIRGFTGSGFGDAYRNGLYNRQDIYDLSNVEQIEVLKGPASILYGRIEPGGLVNYVTKRPLATPYYAIQQQLGSEHQFRTSADLTGPIKADGTLLYRLNASYTDNESFRDHVSSERGFIAPTLTWRPNKAFELNFEVEQKHDRFHPDVGIPAIGSRPANIPIEFDVTDGPKRQSIENTLIAFDWTYRFNDNWKLTNRYLNQDWSYGMRGILSFGLQADNRTLERRILFGKQDVKTQSTNLDLNGKFDGFGAKHNVLIGVDAFYAETVARQLFGIAPTLDIFNPVYGLVDFDSLTTTGNFYRKEKWTGLYFQDQMTFSDKLHVLVGGRYDDVETGANFSTVSMTAAKAGRTPNSDEEFSPRLGVLYELRDWVSVYTSYSQSFGANNGRGANGETFDPEQGKQYEIGLKMQSPSKRLTATVAAFDLTKDNLLTEDPDNSGFSILAGEANSKGLEIDVSGRLTDKLELLATYAYTDAKYTRNNDGLKGNRLANVPLNQGSIWGVYHFNDTFKFGLGAVAVGKREADADNTAQLPGYGRFDAMAAYRKKFGQSQLTLQLNVNNLLDKKYFANSDGGRDNIVPGWPRSVLGSVKYEF